MPLSTPVRPSSTSTAAVVIDSNCKQPTGNDAKVCWIEVKQYPYQPDHQVELLHLQAEADALLIKLQATGQKQLAQQSASLSSPLN